MIRDPFSEMEDMYKRMSRVFEDMDEDFNSFPSADVSESDGEIVVKIDLPGVSRDEVDLVACESYIEVCAEHEEAKEEKEEEYHRKERSLKKYDRKISLPKEIDTETVSAELENGVLEVRAEKKEKEKKKEKKIEVE